MSTKTATLNLVGEMRFEARLDSGHTIAMDNGVGDTGARPAELVGAALGGCTAMDVISILRKKRQPVTGYEIRVTGTQADGHPNNFTGFEVVHVVDGDGVEVEAVRRAIELSATKFCSVGSTLASGDLQIRHRYVVRAPGAEDQTGEVLVTGPNTPAVVPVATA